MAKYWEPGRVKTRLGTSIGMETSARLHQAFCLHLARTLSTSADCRSFVVTPNESTVYFHKELTSTWRVEAQGEGNLGDRMCRWFSASGDKESRILIGGDCPQLNARLIDSAIDLLREHEMVLGPARDGGYYLIGISQPNSIDLRHLFHGIAWSSQRVFSDTVARVSQLGLSLGVMETLSDIDMLLDLERLRHELGSSERSEDARLHEQIEDILRCGDAL